MADKSEKGIEQCGGIMVYYLYMYAFSFYRNKRQYGYLWMAFTDTGFSNTINIFRLENIEEYASSYSATGIIHTSPNLS